MIKIQTFLLLAMMMIAGSMIAQNGFTQADRDLLIRNSEEIKALRNEMNIRFDAADKRTEDLRKDMNNRFEVTDKRMDEMRIDTNKRMDELLTVMGWIVGAFIAITLGSIGYAWYDRRLAMRPLEKRTKEVEVDIIVLEDDIIELKKGTRLEKVITAFRDLAKEDPKVAEILKNNFLL